MDSSAPSIGPIAAVALVTGAASGIGLACAHRLAKLATGGLLLIDNDEEALERVADEIGEKGDAPERVSMLAFDVGDEARWAQASEFISAHYGRLDWAVVNAGISHASPIDETSFSDWKRVLSVNLDGAFLTMRAVLPFMKANQTGGSIVALSSASALKAEEGVAAYGASKAGLLQLAKVAAKEGAAHNVRVNVVAPGGVETQMWRSTPMFQDLVRDIGSERGAFDAIAKAGTPLGRFSTADEIAHLVELLLVDTAPITGAVLVADGGYLL